LSGAADNVADVAARWSTESVLALAPDASSQRAAAGLARPAPWSGTGAAGDLVWGLCAGSGQHPYQAIADLTGPAYKCSCPSRKFPCKHVLALLLTWAQGGVPEAGQPSDYARAWQEGRAAAASRRAPAAEPADGGAGGAGDAEAGANGAGANGAGANGAGANGAGPRAAGNQAAAARRSQQRARRVAAGVAELQTWLGDQVLAGLSGASASRYGHAEAIAARMVDAQAPGLAGVLRRLSGIPASGDGWPDRLLGEYALLHLLTRAHDRLDALPPGLGAVVRSRIGYTTGREEVLAAPAVTDRWQVIAVRDLPDAPVPARRTWLRGRDAGRYALLLSFAPSGYFGANPDAVLAAGTELHADVHYYPGPPPVRAITGARHGAPAASPRPEGAGDLAALLGEWAAALAQDPWLTEWPALLTGTPAEAAGRWYLTDPAGAAVPLLGREGPWPLLAVSGGQPVTVAGEWSPAGLTALTAWHGDRAVTL
jgi:SWIM zinc finger